MPQGRWINEINKCMKWDRWELTKTAGVWSSIGWRMLVNDDVIPVDTN